MENRYKNNLKALYETNRELYNRLISLKSNEKFDLFIGKDPIDANILDNSTKTALYNNPKLDLNSELKELEPLYKYPFLVFFGIGNGFLFNSLLGNKNFLNIVIIEPEIELIYIALHLNDFTKAFENLRLIIIHSDDLTQSTAMTLTKLKGFGVYVKLYNLQMTTDFYSRYSHIIEQVNRTMVDAIIQSVKSHGNDLEDSLIGIDHFLDNLYEIVENIPLREILNKKNSEVAICVATGPSLTKQLPLLKEIQNNVTIFCVDASLPILEKWEIVPDFVASLERVKETAQFFQKTSEAFQKKVGSFVLSAVQHKDVINAVKGKKIIALRPFGYMQVFNLEQYGYAGIGMSAANFNYELAYLMGYKTIVLIGQDLAYSEDEKSSHASEHIFGEMEDHIAKRMSQEDKKEMIYLPKWGGNGTIRSSEVWVLFRNYFIQYFSESYGVNIIDATEGGAHIDGAKDLPFNEVIKSYVDSSFNKNKIILDIASDEMIKSNKNRISEVIKDMVNCSNEAIKKIEKLQYELLDLIVPIENIDRNEQIKKIDITKADKLIKKIENLKAWLFKDKREKYFWETLRGLVVNLELDIAKLSVKIDKTLDEQKDTKIEFLFAHRFWIYAVLNSIKAQNSILLKRKKYIET